MSPLVAPIGWTFFFYIGLCLGEKILGFSISDIEHQFQVANFSVFHEIWEYKLLPLLISVAIFTGFVSYAIESCAINVGWWEYPGYTANFVPNPVQYMWTQSAVIFILLIFLIYFKQIRTTKNFLFFGTFTLKYIAEDFSINI